MGGLARAAAVAGLCLAGAAPAGAAPPAFTIPVGVGSNEPPVLAGNSVIFETATALGPPTVKIAGPDGRVRVLHGLTRLARTRSELTNFTVAASGSHVLAGVDKQGCGDFICVPHDRSYYADRIGSAPELIEHCAPQTLDSHLSGAVDGPRAAFIGCGPRDGGEPVIIRNLDDRQSAALTIPPPDGLEYLGVVGLGRYLVAHAWVVDGHAEMLVGFDPLSGAEAFRVPWGGKTSVQHDGTLVHVRTGQAPEFEGPNQCPARRGPVEWTHPGEAAAHQLPYEACLEETLIAGDRILFHRPLARGLNQLVATDLSGQAPMAVAPPAKLARRVAFDGNRLAYSEHRCRGEGIVVDTLARIEAAGFRRAKPCPIRFAGRIHQRGRALLIPYRCARGCDGVADILPPGGDDPLTMRPLSSRPGVGSVARVALYSRGDRPSSIHRRRVVVALGQEQPDGTFRHARRTITVRTSITSP